MTSTLCRHLSIIYTIGYIRFHTLTSSRFTNWLNAENLSTAHSKEGVIVENSDLFHYLTLNKLILESKVKLNSHKYIGSIKTQLFHPGMLLLVLISF